jgi:hypothetical protein
MTDTPSPGDDGKKHEEASYDTPNSSPQASPPTAHVTNIIHDSRILRALALIRAYNYYVEETINMGTQIIDTFLPLEDTQSLYQAPKTIITIAERISHIQKIDEEETMKRRKNPDFADQIFNYIEREAVFRTRNADRLTQAIALFAKEVEIRGTAQKMISEPQAQIIHEYILPCLKSWDERLSRSIEMLHANINRASERRAGTGLGI